MHAFERLFLEQRVRCWVTEANCAIGIHHKDAKVMAEIQKLTGQEYTGRYAPSKKSE